MSAKLDLRLLLNKTMFGHQMRQFFASHPGINKQEAYSYIRRFIEDEFLVSEHGFDLGEKPDTTKMDPDTFVEYVKQEDAKALLMNPVGQFDAKKWADAFEAHLKVDLNLANDKETMFGWFANSIMAGYDHALAEKDKQQNQNERTLSQAPLGKACKHVMNALVDLGLMPNGIIGFEFTRYMGRTVINVSIQGWKSSMKRQTKESFVELELFVTDNQDDDPIKYRKFAEKLLSRWNALPIV